MARMWRNDDEEIVIPDFASIAHDDFVADIRMIAATLAADTAWRADFIVGIGRGGLVPAVYLSHATGWPTLSCDWSSRVPDFADAVLVRLAARTRHGERLLFVDDINDSGVTLGTLRTALHGAGAVPGSIRIATLIDNATSTERVDYRARRIDRSVTKDWFIFPWESVASDAAIAQDAAAVPGRTG